VDNDQNGYVDDLHGCSFLDGETCQDINDDSRVQHGTGVGGVIIASTNNN
jgi:hypothetical protein